MLDFAAEPKNEDINDPDTNYYGQTKFSGSKC
jgi:hypothetical protein